MVINTRLYNKDFSRLGCKDNFSTHRKPIFRKILRWLNPQRSDKILEIGCNRGELVKKLQIYSGQVVGIDINQWAINTRVTNSVLPMSAEKLAFKNEQFDKVVSCLTIEHIKNLQEAFKEISRVLRTRGLVVLIYPFDIFRGMTAMHSAWVTFRDLKKARQLHVNRLSPWKIRKLTAHTSLTVVSGGILWGYLPNYYTILRKSLRYRQNTG